MVITHALSDNEGDGRPTSNEKNGKREINIVYWLYRMVMTEGKAEAAARIYANRNNPRSPYILGTVLLVLGTVGLQYIPLDLFRRVA